MGVSIRLNLLEQLTELRETRMFSSLLKVVIKVTEEKLDEDVHRVRSTRVPHAGGQSPWSCVRCPTPKLSESCLFFFFIFFFFFF